MDLFEFSWAVHGVVKANGGDDKNGMTPDEFAELSAALDAMPVAGIK